MPEALPRHESFINPPGSPSHTRRTSLKILNRNIDQIVLGNILFDTWYFSPYPENVIFGPDYQASRLSSSNGDLRNGHVEKPVVPLITRLYVCPYCFRYSTENSHYVTHLHLHLKALAASPEEWRPVPRTALKVYEWDGYTVWEVDGEQEKLYCQNLSLFAKLFLEQKSVFFDTSGFHYFVLTYQAPKQVASPLTGKAHVRRRQSSSKLSGGFSLTTQVLGFFSKENLSWDSNNLACILVFPPFQHRNLGQLLMAISYKLSGWEWEDSIIGGPEKPLSVLGKKSYLRFWSERIARFFMSQTTDAEGHTLFEEASKKRTTWAQEEMSIKEIGEKTGMLAEDVMAALQEMGVCEFNSDEGKNKSDNVSPPDGPQEPFLVTMTVRRTGILAWAEKHKVDLNSPIKEEGFLGEWALSDSTEDRSVAVSRSENDLVAS